VPLEIDGAVHLHSGKVRDLYTFGDHLLMVASDRISAYDFILEPGIPDKGEILTRLSLWWFEQLAGVVANHVVSDTDVPADWAGRAIRCRRLEMVPVECIARGYLAGLGLTEYQKNQAIAGVPLPAGLVEGSRLPEPVFTPTTKAPVGEHDEFITLGEVSSEVGAELAEELRRVTLEVYRRGAAIAGERGVIVADTKLEFGRTADGTLVLADEVLTPDSSRFWPADRWEPGRTQLSFDKQLVRDWAVSTGWDKRPPAPVVPDEVVELTRARYVEVFERITGESWA